MFMIVVIVVVFIVLGCFFSSEDEKIDQSTYKQGTDNSGDEKLLIEVLYPVVDILSYYSILIDNKWTSEKVRFIKEIFIKDCNTDQQLILLRERIKNYSNLNRSISESIAKYLFLEPHSESKETLFRLILSILQLQTEDKNKVQAIAIDFGSKININEKRILDILYDFGFYEKSKDDEINVNKNIKWALKILELDFENLNKENINKAFRLKVREFHPDKNGNVTEAVKEILNNKTSEIYEARDILLTSI